jgi:hypothetical protein
LFAGRHVLSLRKLNHRGRDHSRRKYRFHHDAPVMTLSEVAPRANAFGHGRVSGGFCQPYV